MRNVVVFVSACVLATGILCNCSEREDTKSGGTLGNTGAVASFPKAGKKTGDEKLSTHAMDECLAGITLEKRPWDTSVLTRECQTIFKEAFSAIGNHGGFDKYIEEFEKDASVIRFNVFTYDKDRNEEEILKSGECRVTSVFDKVPMIFDSWTRDPGYIENIDKTKNYALLHLELRFAGEFNNKYVIVLLLDTNSRYFLAYENNRWVEGDFGGHGADTIVALVLTRNVASTAWEIEVLEKTPRDDKEGIKERDICNILLKEMK